MDFDLALDCQENKEVMRIASQRFKIPRADKQQCKLLGLWDAVNLFDEKRGVPFKLFLSLRVKFRCLKWCTENYDPRMKYVDMFDNQFVNIDEESKHSPNMCDISDYTRNSSNTVRKYKKYSFTTDLLLSLNDEEKELITQRFVENRTLEDIGKQYNLSYETIRKRINSILEKFKD